MKRKKVSEYYIKNRINMVKYVELFMQKIKTFKWSLLS